MVTVFRNFPLSIHPNAVPAAKAAYCAGQQNPKQFWDMHDWLFANQNTLGQRQRQGCGDQFRKQAVAFGVDGAKYDACLTDAKTDAGDPARHAGWASSWACAARLRSSCRSWTPQGKPAITKNISGALPFDQFDQTIKSILN